MRIRLEDITMDYEEQGEGIPLLLIHGFPLSKEMWKPQIEELSKNARVLAPDLRGHGQSQHTFGIYSMNMLAKDLANFLDAKGIQEPVVLCGLSMGGYVAFAFCRSFPERTKGLILAATRSAPDSVDAKIKREEMAAVAVEIGPGAVANTMLPKMLAPSTYERKAELVEAVRTMMQSTSRDGMEGALLGMKERPDSLPTIQKFDGPSLILHGADDQIIPPSEAEAMKKSMKNARLEIIEEAGHLLNMEQPEKFNHAVVDFLRSL
jgi:3-oxoadipate enol-lactonase